VFLDVCYLPFATDLTLRLLLFCCFHRPGERGRATVPRRTAAASGAKKEQCWRRTKAAVRRSSVVRIAAHTADKPTEAERDSHRGIRPTFNGVAQKLFPRRSVFLHRPCSIASGLFRLPIRVLGCILRLSKNVLGSSGCLLDLAL